MKSTHKKLLIFLLFSLLIGFVNGLLGGGGGMICVPILKLFLNLEDKKAHATSILVTSLLSISTLIVYITTLNLDFSFSPFLCAGVLFGGFVGNVLLKKFSNKTLNIIFIFVMFVAGLKSVIG